MRQLFNQIFLICFLLKLFSKKFEFEFMDDILLQVCCILNNRIAVDSGESPDECIAIISLATTSKEVAKIFNHLGEILCKNYETIQERVLDTMLASRYTRPSYHSLYRSSRFGIKLAGRSINIDQLALSNMSNTLELAKQIFEFVQNSNDSSTDTDEVTAEFEFYLQERDKLREK